MLNDIAVPELRNTFSFKNTGYARLLHMKTDTMITMETVSRQSVADEDQIVAELHQLGITYLSNRLTLPRKALVPPKSY